MSRLFTGSNTDRIAGTILPIASGQWSMGCWSYCTTLADTRLLGSSGFTNFCGQGGTPANARYRLYQGHSSTDMILESSSSKLVTNVWQCVVFAFAGSVTAASSSIYVGDLAAGMADAGHGLNQDGIGTQKALSAAQSIGNDVGGSISWPGRIAQMFMVPWQMTLADAEKFRCGDLSVLTASGSPRFYLPLDGSNLLDTLGGTGTWTATGATASADPNFAKVADRAVRNSTGTGTATLTLTNPTLIRPGNYLVARVSVDNSGSSGARPGLTVTDTRNGTWTHGTGGLQDPGAASAGNATYLCYVNVTTAYQAGDTVVFTWTTGTPVSAIVIEEWFGINKTTPLAVAETQANNVSSTAQPAIARTPALAGQLVYVCAGLEGISTSWGTQDADTTDGLWSDLTKDNANTGTASTSESVYGGCKMSVGTTAQTWNNTLGVTSDWSACAVVFAIEPGPVAVQGTAGAVAVTGDTATIATPAAPLPPHNLRMVPGYAVHRSTLV